MSIPQSPVNSNSRSRLKEAAQIAQDRGCRYFVQSRMNGTVSFHRKQQTAVEAAKKYTQKSPGLCRARVYNVNDGDPQKVKF